MRNDMELRHVLDLAEKSYRNNQYTFTDFLNPAGLSDFYSALSELPPCGFEISGGYEGAERTVIRFGREEDLGYVEDFPIICLRIEPLMAKFADDLSHRDVLGAIMNTGMEREKLGDIMIRDNIIWVFCLPSMADVITREITRIKHTSVKCVVEETLPEALKPHYESISIQAASERIDGVISKLCKLSRSASSELFMDGKVAVNGRELKNHSYLLKEEDIISVRGYGKYKYYGISGTTRKGNQIIRVDRYV